MTSVKIRNRGPKVWRAGQAQRLCVYTLHWKKRWCEIEISLFQTPAPCTLCLLVLVLILIIQTIFDCKLHVALNLVRVPIVVNLWRDPILWDLFPYKLCIQVSRIHTDSASLWPLTWRYRPQNNSTTNSSTSWRLEIAFNRLLDPRLVQNSHTVNSAVWRCWNTLSSVILEPIMTFFYHNFCDRLTITQFFFKLKRLNYLQRGHYTSLH